MGSSILVLGSLHRARCHLAGYGIGTLHCAEPRLRRLVPGNSARRPVHAPAVPRGFHREL